MSETSESGGGVRITSREIYDQMIVLSGDVRQVLDAIPRIEAAHQKQHDEYDKRLENHGDRIRDLEAASWRESALPAQVATIASELTDVQAKQNRASWVPGLIMGALGTGVGAFVLNAINATSPR